MIWGCQQKFKNIARGMEYLNFFGEGLKNDLQYFRKHKTIENRLHRYNTTFNNDRQMVRLSRMDPFFCVK